MARIPHTRSASRPKGMVSLARALSKLGLATRSEARALVLANRVAIDGRPVADPAAPVVPERIRIAIDGVERRPPDRVTIVLHKPRGVVTTRRDPLGRTTVYDLIGDLDAHVVPVGRLDYATSGLLVMTGDTRLADWLTDPANAVIRTYLVTVRGRVTEGEAAALARGVRSGDELLQARSVSVRKASGRESHLVIELAEGKNREIRRFVSAIERDVTRLRRVQVGGLTIEGLAPGEWRRVEREALHRAFPGAPIAVEIVRRTTRHTKKSRIRSASPTPAGR